MSKYLGKIFCEMSGRTVGVDDDVNSSVRYVDSGGGWYVFKVSWMRRTFKLARWLVEEMVSVKNEKQLWHLYQWSVGYKVLKKKDASCWKEMLFEEMECFGGSRKELILSGAIESDEDFIEFCKVQYLFKVSLSVLIAARRLWKNVKVWHRGSVSSGWLLLERRVDASERVRGKYKKSGVGGVGGRGAVDSYGFSKCIDEEMYLHNQRVALDKRFRWMFIENEKVWCESCGEEWSKEKEENALQKWKDMS